MKQLLAFLLFVPSLCLAQSITLPYNPDANGDSLISAPDLLELLPVFGGPFLPQSVTVDGQPLQNVLESLNATIDSLASVPNIFELNSNGNLPFGTILPTASPSVPDGWMICDGREIPIDEFQDLYDRIGTTYGAGDSAFWAQVFYPATTFNIPDLRGRTIIGGDAMGPNGAAQRLVENESHLGASGGEEQHELTLAELPEHSHEVPGYVQYNDGGSQSSGDIGLGAPTNNNPINVTVQTASAGGNQSHNVVQPYLALNFMMKVSDNTVTALNLQEQVDSLAAELEALKGTEPGCNNLTSLAHYGYDYELVEIFDQCWFRENLRTHQFSNGDLIPNEWSIYNFSEPWGMEACSSELGWLYNGPARTDQRNICPSGWHVPTPLDWSQLAGSTLGSSLTGNSMSGIDLDNVSLFYDYDTGQPDCVEVDYNSYGIYGAQYNVPPPGVTAHFTTVVLYSTSPFFEWENNTPGAGTLVRCIKD